MPIVMAHPSFPWQDEAISVALHKPQVRIDLSGWAPHRFPQQLVSYIGGPLRDQALFGSDYPLIAPDRWLAEFADLGLDQEVQQSITKGNAATLLGLG